MYLDFFGLSSSPFSIAPDPNFLYLTEKHQEALAHLEYSTAQKGGFVLLTGEIGTGKTTLCRHFLKAVPEQYQTAFIFNPKISSEELLATICDEFTIARPDGVASVKQLTDLINGRLLEIHAAGKNALLVIDEAQNLSLEVLEQVRLLTNLETTEHKLLQIVLIGQPQLRTLLRREELRQLAQRIVARYHLEPLSAAETERYIGHRLLTAGSAAAGELFPAASLRAIHRITQGVPRLINVLCDRALLGAYVENSRVVSRRIVGHAAREVFADEPAARRSWPAGWRWGALAAGLAIVAGLWLIWPSSAPLFQGMASERKAEVATLAGESGQPLFSSPGKEAAAYRSLLKLWDVAGETADSAASEKDACLAANRSQLRCLSASNKNWQQFSQFNLPAVLTLRGGDQREIHALLESVKADQAKLLIDGQAVTLTLGQLAFYWTGKFTLLWRPPSAELANGPLTQKALSELMKTPPPWLLERLGASTSKRLALRQLIANFQSQAGIQSDGVIGLQTLVMLSRSAEDTPALQRQ
ncbi:MAG: peptidoglycan-binding protein [Proteobacteria bacterium]|nr:peptidoglycan-binding protein [Pseudomonadota bacterium]